MRRKRIIIVFMFISFFSCFSKVSSLLGEEFQTPRYGLSFLKGWDVKFFHKQPNFKTIGIFPRIDFNIYRSIDFELEGNFSYYGVSKEKDIYLLGVNANILFKPFQLKNGSLFLIGGTGIGYTNCNGRISKLGDSHAGGLLQLGAGLYLGKGLLIRGEYRYLHISDPFRSDPGLNSHNILLGLSF